jgi:hypothetical protein
MREILATQDLSKRPDSEAHCIAAGLIARRCSVGEAWLASYGKEVRDLLGRGDAEWRDIESDRRGIQCARSATGRGGPDRLPERLIECCESAPER